MNIYLVPYTPVRHIVVALATGTAALVAWFATLFYVLWGAPILHSIGMLWWQSADGAGYLGGLAASVAFTSVLAEGSLRRRPLIWRIAYAIVGGGVAGAGTIAIYGAYAFIAPYLTLGDEGMRAIIADGSLVTLRYKLFQWVNLGFWTGVGAFFARRGQALLERYGFGLDKVKGLDEFVTETPKQELPGWGVFFAELAYHLFGGLAAALAGCAVWHALGYYDWAPGDLYYASCYGALTFGILFGLLTWPIPDELYAGWVRVLSAERYGIRVPIDRPGGGSSERFIGHFPRGLDLYLPAEAGIAELHTSFVTNGKSRYTVRGLSIQQTLVKRPLERIDLRYDPSRPAPLETELKMEDRILLKMNDGTTESVVEFLMLPKEEM